MKYNQPVGGAADDPYVTGDASQAIEGSVVPGEAIEAPQREIVHVIEQSGQTPDAANNTQLFRAIAALVRQGSHAVTIARAVFGDAVTDGMAVRWDADNNRFDRAVADGTAHNLAVGLADVTNGEVVCFGLARAGLARNGLLPDLTPGSRYWLDGTTGGAVTATRPDDAIKIGIAQSADRLFVDIDGGGGGDASIGKHTLTVPAEAWSSTISNGCSWFSRKEVAANRPEIGYVAYDTGVEETAEARITMPKSWDGGAIQCQALWSHGMAPGHGTVPAVEEASNDAPASNEAYGVAFGFRAVFLGNDDAHNQAFGTEVVVTDTGGTADDLYVSAVSEDITPGGTVSQAGILVLRCTRKVAQAHDTLNGDARLQDVRVTYTTNAGTDD